MPSIETSAEIDALSDLGLEGLRQRWKAKIGRPVPDVTSVSLLRRWLSWELQARNRGGLDAVTLRHLRELGRSMTSASGRPHPSRPKPGTVLTREHGGKTHRVMVLERGYAWEGTQYASLSEVAYRITGTRWSGPRFFGLLSRKRRS